MTAGSVVGLPSGPSSVSAATASPLLRATRTLPIAMRLVAMSATIGRSGEGPGIAMVTGLVPKRASLPRHGATAGRWSVMLTNEIDTSPAAAHISP
jgi:hypothetical protein